MVKRMSPLWFYREIDLNILMRLCPFNNNNNKRERENLHMLQRVSNPQSLID